MFGKKVIYFTYCSLIFLLATQPYFLFSQERINGRAVLQGTWKGQEIEYVQGQVAVILKAGREKADIQALLDQHGASAVRDFDKLGWGLLELPASEDIFALMKDLEKSDHIETVEPNTVDHIQFDPNDSFFSDGTQWALKNTGQVSGGSNDADIDAPEAWDITLGSSNTIIAILDTGIPMINGALSHPDLDDPSKFILGPDYSDPNNMNGDGVRDMHSHGSHVAGTASAETNNSTGVAGVAGNCKVMIVQVFNSSGSGASSWFRDGVIYAVDNGAKVINYSGGGGSNNSTKVQAIQYADANDVLIVAAAGNDNGGSVIYPAAYSATYDNVIAVGATNHNDDRAGYSNIGPELNVVAPGGHGGGLDANDIWSTTPNYPGYTWESYGVTQNYSFMSGTSMATPHVSGVAGLLFDLAPSLTPLQVRSTIEQTVDDKGPAGWDNEYGHGRLNAYNAVNLIVSPPAAPQSFFITNRGSNGQHPILQWDANTEPDLDHYAIYRGYQDSKTDPINWLSSPSGTTSNTTWTDPFVTISSSAGSRVNYRVTAVDVANNESGYSNSDYVNSFSVPKAYNEDTETTAELPTQFRLHTNYPNPFNPETQIQFELPEAAQVNITIYNVVGADVQTLTNSFLSAGSHSVTWNGKDMLGAEVASGVYIYRLEVRQPTSKPNNLTFTKKMMLLR